MSACKYRVSGSLSLPSRGSFHRSFTVLSTIGHQVVFRLGGWAPRLPTGLLVSDGTLDTTSSLPLSTTGLSPSMVCVSTTLRLTSGIHIIVRNPECIATLGLASFHFARRYFENRCFFLFLRLLRCFSSAGFPLYSYVFTAQYVSIAHVGCPIRKSAGLWLFAPLRSLSQLITSFFGS